MIRRYHTKQLTSYGVEFDGTNVQEIVDFYNDYDETYSGGIGSIIMALNDRVWIFADEGYTIEIRPGYRVYRLDGDPRLRWCSPAGGQIWELDGEA